MHQLFFFKNDRSPRVSMESNSTGCVIYLREVAAYTATLRSSQMATKTLPTLFGHKMVLPLRGKFLTLIFASTRASNSRFFTISTFSTTPRGSEEPESPRPSSCCSGCQSAPVASSGGVLSVRTRDSSGYSLIQRCVHQCSRFVEDRKRAGELECAR